MRNVAVAIAALLMASQSVAAKKRPLDFEALSSRAYESVHSHVNHNQRLDYQLGSLTTMNLAVHIVGAAESIKQGHTVRETYGIDDPSTDISIAVANDIARRLKVPVTNSRNVEFRSVFAGVAGLQDEKELVANVGPGKLVVNAGSTMWAVYRRGKDRYFVSYWASVEIIDSTTASSIWKGGCALPSGFPKKSDLPLSASILDNDAESLKQEITKVKDACIQHILTELTGTAGDWQRT